MERLSAVQVHRRGAQTQLAITSAGNAGKERIVIPFAAEAEALLEFAAELLRPFLPGRQRRALLRLYEVESPGLYAVQSASADAPYETAEVLAARGRFREEAHLDEPVLADSLVPPTEPGQPTRWFAVTASRLALITEGAREALMLPFGDLTTSSCSTA